MKICTKCKAEKDEAEFYKRKPKGFSSACKECVKRAAIQWNKTHPDKAAAAISSWQKTHKEGRRASCKKWRDKDLPKERARNAKWRSANPERVKANKQRWSKENPEKDAAKTARRRASKLQATPVWANDFFIEEAYDLAQRRNKATGIRWEVDHIVPLQSELVCGLHNEFNLQVIPKRDNASKGNRYWPDMPV